jgi:hypothetical protein
MPIITWGLAKQDGGLQWLFWIEDVGESHSGTKAVGLNWNPLFLLQS